MFRLLRQLGRDSRFHKAQFDDPAMAQAILDHEAAGKGDGSEPEKWRPAARDWNFPLEMQAMIWDRLGAIASLLTDLPTAPGLTRRHRMPDPFPRPLTELDRLRAERAAEEEARYYDRLFTLVDQAQDRWRRMSEEERASLGVSVARDA